MGSSRTSAATTVHTAACPAPQRSDTLRRVQLVREGGTRRVQVVRQGGGGAAIRHTETEVVSACDRRCGPSGGGRGGTGLAGSLVALVSKR